MLSGEAEPPSWLEHRAELGLRQAAGAKRQRFYKIADVVTGPIYEHTGPSDSGVPQKINRPIQAFPFILAHHQRTPTNRKRQSWKNSGGLPSKACPMNWSSHPATNSPKAGHHSR